MRINIARCSGFCFGVKRAIGMAEKALDVSGGSPICSLGPIIHNRDVVEGLDAKGLKVVEGLGRCKKGATVLICSHGVPPRTLKAAQKKGFSIIDATCPYVKKAQAYAAKLNRDGYDIIIVGDKRHPEVKSILGFSGNRAFAISTASEASKMRLGRRKAGVVAQTTQNRNAFASVVEQLAQKGFSELRIFDTICGDAAQRQKQVPYVTKKNDLVLVIGGKNSANTRRLYELAGRAGANVYHIENAGQLRMRWLKGIGSVGIMSGASTPDWIIKEVVDKAKGISLKRAKSRTG